MLRDDDRPLFVGSNQSTPVRNTCFEGHRGFFLPCEIIQVFPIVLCVVRDVNKFDVRLVIRGRNYDT